MPDSFDQDPDWMGDLSEIKKFLKDGDTFLYIEKMVELRGKKGDSYASAVEDKALERKREKSTDIPKQDVEWENDVNEYYENLFRFDMLRQSRQIERLNERKGTKYTKTVETEALRKFQIFREEEAAKKAREDKAYAEMREAQERSKKAKSSNSGAEKKHNSSKKGTKKKM